MMGAYHSPSHTVHRVSSAYAQSVSHGRTLVIYTIEKAVVLKTEKGELTFHYSVPTASQTVATEKRARAPFFCQCKISC